MNDNKSTKEYMLEQKLSVINELINLIREYNISEIKRLCKENKDIQLKLLNVKTEILKIEDKLEDILSLYKINNANEMKNATAQFFNMVNEEKAAYLIASKNSFDNFKANSNDLSISLNHDYNSCDALHEELSKEDLEEKKIRESFDRMIDMENRSLYDAVKEEEGYPDNYDDYSVESSEDEDLGYQDFLDWRYEKYKKLYKEFYALVNSENVKSWRNEDFEKYMKLREEGSVKITFCDDKAGNVRIYSKYDWFGLIKDKQEEGLKRSKRQLPTEIFEYLISNNIIKEKDFEKFSTNQFGRTFESKMGDILTEDELPKDANRQKRYNEIDFSDVSKYPHSTFKGKLYISNQWSEDSIFKFIDYIRRNYNDYVMIIDPHKKLIEEINSKEIDASVDLKQYTSDSGIYEYEVKPNNV